MKNIITRTITSQKAVLMCVDTVNAEVFNKEVVLPRTYKDEDALLKAAKAAGETETCKVVQVVHTETEEKVYGMDVTDFIKYGHEINK